MGSILKNKSDFEQLFLQYYPVLCNVSRGYVRNKIVIEEIVTDVFVKLWSNRTQINIHTSIKDYLFRSVQNACIDYLRAEQKYLEQTSYIDDNQIVCTTLVDLGENPLDYLVGNEVQQRILEAIDELPERYRMTFRLSRMDGFNYDEVANIMGITKNTVKSNLRDAVAILQEKLKDLK